MKSASKGPAIWELLESNYYSVGESYCAACGGSVDDGYIVVFSFEIGVEFLSGCAGDKFCLGYFLELFV